MEKKEGGGKGCTTSSYFQMTAEMTNGGKGEGNGEVSSDLLLFSFLSLEGKSNKDRGERRETANHFLYPLKEKEKKQRGEEGF